MIDFLNPAVQRRVDAAERVAAQMARNLASEQQHLALISRDLVASLGLLAIAEAAQRKACSPVVDRKVEQLREEVRYLRHREEVSGRIVADWNAKIETFLAEGTPTNAELLTAAKEFEEVVAEVKRL
jgi:hypothetical protein